MCPYKPKHFKDSVVIRKEVIQICTKEELEVISGWYFLFSFIVGILESLFLEAFLFCRLYLWNIQQ